MKNDSIRSYWFGYALHGGAINHTGKRNRPRAAGGGRGGVKKIIARIEKARKQTINDRLG